MPTSDLQSVTTGSTVERQQSSSPSPPSIPPRPLHTDLQRISLQRTAQDRFFNFQSLSSPMLLSSSTSNSSTPVEQKRASAPAEPRHSITPQGHNHGRTRSHSQVQIPLFSPASSHRPLPALPGKSGSGGAPFSASDADSIKVPVDVHSPSSVVSPLTFNANRLLYPNGPSARSNSPQLGSQQPMVHQGATASFPLEYHSSISSKGSSRPSEETPRSSASDLRGSSPSAWGVPSQGHGHGHAREEAAKHFESSSSSSPATSFASPSPYSPRLLQNHPKAQGPSSSSSSLSLNPTGDLQPYYPPPPAHLSPLSPQLQHQQQQQHTLNSTQSSHTQKGSTHTASHPNMTLGPSLPSTRGRRHSSSAGSLSIQTHKLGPLKKGPNTADGESRIVRNAGGGGGSSIGGHRYIEPDTVVKGTARKHLKSIIPSKPNPSHHPLPRQSPNHLVIPQPSHVQSSHSRSHPSQQHPHHQQHPQQPRQNSPQPRPSDTRQLQHQQHPHQRHQQQQQQQQQNTQENGSRVLDTLPDRTSMALMQRYLTHPDDPDSEMDIAMQILISQAAVDSKGFEVLVPQTVESIKRHHATLSSRITALTARLSLESKIREAAQSLLKLHAGNKKLARQASDHLDAANRKVDQVATELWKLTQLASDLQRTLLQHTSGVLALGVVRLEDQARREREIHALQVQQAYVNKDVEEQLDSMARTISNLESDALEAHSLLEDKDRAIERLMRQLEHQRDLFIQLDEQQQRTMAMSRSQQRDLDALGQTDSMMVSDIKNYLCKVGKRLYGILQMQQQQQDPQATRSKREPLNPSADEKAEVAMDRNNSFTRNGVSHKGSLESAIILSESNRQGCDSGSGPFRADSVSTMPSDSGLASSIGTATIANSPPLSTSKDEEGAHFSVDAINSTLDALEQHCAGSHQKMLVLESELGLLRRQSMAISESRNSSIRIKSRPAVEETIRAALEKSLKDALLEKEMARQELENERQKWQDDQNHRIQALEESLVAVEDADKVESGMQGNCIDSSHLSSREDAVQELRRQLREAIEEIDVLSLQQQSSLKSMRKLFDLLPDSRRKSHLQLFSYHQQQQHQQQHQITGSPGASLSVSGRASPASSVSSLSLPATVGFSMEALLSRVKDLVARSQQLELDNDELQQQVGQPMTQSRQTPEPMTSQDSRTESQSTWILKSDLERLQANAGMIQLLEKELELLKQHTDLLLDENARLADLAASVATGTPTLPAMAVSPSRKRVLSENSSVVQKPSVKDSLEELQEKIRVKDLLLRERDQLVQQQEQALCMTRAERNASTPPLSAFDVQILEDFRVKCGKLEEQVGEMRMVIAALESLHGGPGYGAQLVAASASVTSPSPSTTSWFASSLGAVGALSFSSLTASSQGSAGKSALQNPVTFSPPSRASSNEFFGIQGGPTDDSRSSTGSNSNSDAAVVAGATAALRKEFRRVMGDLREEKEKLVRKEVEERRRLERVVRQLRREIQTLQNTTATTA